MLPFQRLTSWALALSAGVSGVSSLAAPLVAQPAPLALTDLLDVRTTSAGALSEVASRYVVPAALGEWMARKPSVERAMTAWYRELGAR